MWGCIKITVKNLQNHGRVLKKMKKITAKSQRSIYCTVCTQKVTILLYISNYIIISNPLHFRQRIEKLSEENIQWKSSINSSLVCGEWADAIAWLSLYCFRALESYATFVCVAHACLSSEYDLTDSCFIGIETTLQPSSRHTTYSTWHRAHAPLAMSSSCRGCCVCRPSPRTGNNEFSLVVCVVSDSCDAFFPLLGVAG